MDSATGFYLNVFDNKERSWHEGKDVFVIFNEANSEPTAEELEVLIQLVERELDKDPTGNSLEEAIEDSGLKCVLNGVQIRATGLQVKAESPYQNKRGRKREVEASTYFPLRSNEEAEEIYTLAKFIGDYNMKKGSIDERFLPYVREVAAAIYDEGYRKTASQV